MNLVLAYMHKSTQPKQSKEKPHTPTNINSKTRSPPICLGEKTMTACANVAMPFQPMQSP